MTLFEKDRKGKSEEVEMKENRGGARKEKGLKEVEGKGKEKEKKWVKNEKRGKIEEKETKEKIL